MALWRPANGLLRGVKCQTRGFARLSIIKTAIAQPKQLKEDDVKDTIFFVLIVVAFQCIPGRSIYLDC
jgi:hypothetical protein